MLSKVKLSSVLTSNFQMICRVLCICLFEIVCRKLSLTACFELLSDLLEKILKEVRCHIGGFLDLVMVVLISLSFSLSLSGKIIGPQQKKLMQVICCFCFCMVTGNSQLLARILIVTVQ